MYEYKKIIMIYGIIADIWHPLHSSRSPTADGSTPPGYGLDPLSFSLVLSSLPQARYWRNWQRVYGQMPQQQQLHQWDDTTKVTAVSTAALVASVFTAGAGFGTGLVFVGTMVAVEGSSTMVKRERCYTRHKATTTSNNPASRSTSGRSKRHTQRSSVGSKHSIPSSWYGMW